MLIYNCNLTPTKNGQAYVGSVMGREIVFDCSREQVQVDLDRDNPALKKSRIFKNNHCFRHPRLHQMTDSLTWIYSLPGVFSKTS